MTQLKQTPLNALHRNLGARMVDFGGWDMPVQYAGILAEHEAVRTRAGLFDVSHMGEIRVKGPQAEAFLDWLTPNAVKRLAVGQIHYTAFLTDRGTFVDDLLLHKFSETEYLLVVNASNTDKDFEWVKSHADTWDVTVTNESSFTAQIAIQGPRALEILQPLVDLELAPMGYYWFGMGHFKGLPVLLSRTGYTGEDGFEIYGDAEHAASIWNALMEAGQAHGLVPAGLGCRNTLRLEAKMSLYGHEIDDTTHALEADLAWIVKLDKGEFLGLGALLKAKEQGLSRKLIAFRMNEKRDIARDGMAVIENGQPIGHVTSGAPSPTLGANIGLAYVPLDKAVLGQALCIEIRGRACLAEIVKAPFYKRAK